MSDAPTGPMLRLMSPSAVERTSRPGGAPARAGRPVALAAGWARAWRTRPVLGDVALTAGLLLLLALTTTPAIVDPEGALAAPPLALDGHWRDLGWAWALQLALVLPLAWRRTAPVAVLAAVSVVGLVQWLAGPELYGDLAVLIAIYTVVAHDPRVWPTVLAVALAVAALTLAIARWVVAMDAGTPSAIALAAMVSLPVALGLVGRSRRRALTATRESATRGERARIAREMHDVVAHNLSVMVALADGARMTVRRDAGEAETAIAQVARTGRDALEEMRALLGVVHEPGDAAPLRPQPGLDQLPELAEAVRATGLAVHLVVDVDGPLPGGVGLTIHRVVQEALTNVLKHAPRATRADVLVRRTGEQVEVGVRDDGPVPDGRAASDGRGLAGMRDRVGLHGGELQAGPAPGGGWRVRTVLRTGGDA